MKVYFVHSFSQTAPVLWKYSAIDGIMISADNLKAAKVTDARNHLKTKYDATPIEKQRIDSLKIMIDSGAFRQLTTGKKIAEDEIIEWQRKGNGDSVVQLDFLLARGIDDKEAFSKIEQNFQMAKLWIESFIADSCEVIPVIHGHNFIQLDYSISKLYELIDLFPGKITTCAVGSLALLSRYSPQQLVEIAAYTREKIPSSIKLHALGCGNSSATILKRIGFSSVDASSHLRDSKYGMVRHPDNLSMCIIAERTKNKEAKSFDNLSRPRITADALFKICSCPICSNHDKTIEEWGKPGFLARSIHNAFSLLNMINRNQLHSRYAKIVDSTLYKETPESNKEKGDLMKFFIPEKSNDISQQLKKTGFTLEAETKNLFDFKNRNDVPFRCVLIDVAENEPFSFLNNLIILDSMIVYFRHLIIIFNTLKKRYYIDLTKELFLKSINENSREKEPFPPLIEPVPLDNLEEILSDLQTIDYATDLRMRLLVRAYLFLRKKQLIRRAKNERRKLIQESSDYSIYETVTAKICSENVKQLLIISCSDKKNKNFETKDLPALQAYEGKIFQTIKKTFREVGRPKNLSIAILSAEYGLIDESFAIKFYDRKMTRKRAHELKSSVKIQLEELINEKKPDQIVVLVGSVYLHALPLRELNYPDDKIFVYPKAKIGQMQTTIKDLIQKLAKLKD